MSTTEALEFDWFSKKEDACPCRRQYRWLEEETTEEDDESILLWEIIYTCAVLLAMFVALISDKFGADSVMLTALTAFMAARIITVEEGLGGFANEGLMTVLTLFVVADGISKTGALDWYMGKLLGRPTTAASAQLRLMIPVALVSAFLNNTPVVAVMIPIVQRWAKNVRISAQQLLIPLSFASILGGTCTLIGTSTNLVVAELLSTRYDDPDLKIGLFDLGYYGVPVALAGICYILVASRWLLPGGSGSSNRGSTIPLDSQEEILLGARLSPWSPACSRSVKRSGLRDTGGIYLTSVHRAATGNIHRAVGQDFVLNVGDILYFTGLVEGFGQFCEEHGMEVLTSDIQPDNKKRSSFISIDTTKSGHKKKKSTYSSAIQNLGGSGSQLQVVAEDIAESGDIPVEVGVSAKSLMQADEAERKQSITRMIDKVRGLERDEPTAEEQLFLDKIGSRRQLPRKGPHKVVVTSENELVVIGIDANDRPGLLLDISKGLLRLNLSFRHTEASVVHQRSISIWRCEHLETQIPDLEEIWSVLNALLENDGNQAVKKRGLRVIRAAVTKSSSLIGKKVFEVDFRNVYKAAIVAVQKGGRNVAVSSVVFQRGDVIVLQANDDSPLLKSPPSDFYKRPADSNKEGERQGITPVSSLINMVSKTIGSSSSQQKLRPGTSGDLESLKSGTDARSAEGEDSFFFADLAADTPITNDDRRSEIIDMTNSINAIKEEERIWNDLRVLIMDEQNREDNVNSREFLTAMEVAPKSRLAGRAVTESGLDKLSGVFLVSIDRPKPQSERDVATTQVLASIAEASDGKSDVDDTSISIQSIEPGVTAISTGTPLMEGDVLWFAGSASSLGDLRKIPGLVSYESEEVEKMNEKIHDRRLVEAVVARRGPLVGKSVKSIRFRTRYGAAVIAVHRDGNRVQEHPGKIKLQAGDVLLLEAGPTFIKNSMDQDRSFALLAEVKDSAPPRLRLLIPALTIAVAMLAVFTADIGTSLFVCALVASILMVALGILSEQEARDAVNWEVYITIASAFGIGTALVNSGVAASIANFLVDVGNAIGIGEAGLLGAVYFATFLISNVVTNNAAAALLFPIALDAADQTGIDRIIMSYCLMLGASASFMSPFGYTTNLLIYGPGGYKYKDFLVIGTPMQIVLWILSTILLSSMNETTWWMYWAGMFLLLMFIVLSRMINLPRLLPKWQSSSGEPNTSSPSRSTEEEVMAA
ncbi:unnamed protein product [Cylindrotheca closterium]|uniref:RCK C-terminal domain-containing protein n=1 Tax=Cylindrotheca closterium TaxID=2856 RepID=A0AAD2FQU8_9STRA|nr:unnamed protein product [Cylindrotheca closterium]